MAGSPTHRVLPLVWVAAAISLLVTVVRLVGELQGWDAFWFSSEPGSFLNPFGIVWLVPVFGFLFGRRVAQATGRPPFVASFFVPMFGFVVLLAGVGYIARELSPESMRAAMDHVVWGAPVLSLLALFAWPRVFAVNLLYALLARAPVVVVQYLDVHNGWQTHYGRVHPKLARLSADERLWSLTVAQGSLWIPFTLLLAGGAAALGARTVRNP